MVKKNIAILGSQSLIARNLLNIIESQPKSIIKENYFIDFFTIIGGERLIFDNKNFETKNLDSININSYDLIIDLEDNREIVDAMNLLERSSRCITCTEHANMILSIPFINREQIKNNNIIKNPKSAVISIASFFYAIKNFNVEQINITICRSIANFGKNALDMFFREMKACNFGSTKKGLLYEHPMFFNIIPVIDAVNENNDSNDEIRIKNELKEILTIDIVATSIIVPVILGEMVTINFKSNNAQANKIIKQITNNGIVYSDKIITPLMVEHEDAIFATRLRKHDHDWWSIILVYDAIKINALNLFAIVQNIVDLEMRN